MSEPQDIELCNDLRCLGPHSAADWVKLVAERAAKRIEAHQVDAWRWQEMRRDPEAMRHFLGLLIAGKGDAEAMDKLVDRVRASRLKANARQKDGEV